jgi:DNA-binding PadR family transcriptional regulator
MHRPDTRFPTTLGFALIAHAQAQPRTAYALRKLFETTPIGRFSSSPGSIYPALKKLEAAGLTATKDGLVLATAKGRQALRAWLSEPVTLVQVEREPDITLLRFAFLDLLDDPAQTMRFLTSFRAALAEQLSQLGAFLQSESAAAMSWHGKLAVECGRMSCEAQLHWAGHAIAGLKKTTRSKRYRTS